MTDVRVPPLPDEYEVMYNDTVKDLKDIVMKIREEKRGKFSMAGLNVSVSSGRARETVDMIVPANKAGLIIGSHGDTLRRIEKQAQVKMHFDQQWKGGENERRVVITGSPEDIEEARRLIMEKITEDRERGDRGGDRRYNNSSTEQMMVPNTRIGLVIGRGGETVRDIQERSGAKVFVQPDAKVDPATGEKPLTISGDPEAIKIAKGMVNDVIFGVGGAAHQPTLSIEIPESTIGAVMGKRAEILKSIAAASGGIKIFIEHANVSGTQLRQVQFTGHPDSCAYAVQLVQDRVNSFLHGTTGESYTAVVTPSADQNAAASAATANFDYAQYYAAASGQQMDPAAVAAYYAQYYAAYGGGGGAYDSNSSASYNPYDPSNAYAAHDPNYIDNGQTYPTNQK